MMVMSISTPIPGEVNNMGEQTNTNPTPETQEAQTTTTENTEKLETQETETQETEVQETETPETVPLATFLEVKNNLRSLKAKMADIEDSKYSDELRSQKERVYNKWIDNGFDEDTAKAISEEIAGVYEELGKAKKTQGDLFISEQIDELSTDDFYSDIKKYEGQIKSKIKQFKKAGEQISVEDAYVLIAGPKTKMREDRIRNEAIKSTSSQGTGNTNVATASGSKMQNSYKLDANDKKALAELKKMQPSFNWDEKKYYESMIKDRN
jgi:hypothetical protein